MKSKILFSIVLLWLVGTEVFAQVSFKTEYFGSSSYWLDKGDNPRERIGDAKGSAVVYHGNINIPLSMKLNEKEKPVIWGLGLGGSYASLSNKKFTDDLVISQIMNIELGIYHIRPISDKWTLMAGIGGGIYTASTRLSDIRWKHVLGSVNAIFIYQVRPNLQLGGGLAINSTFGYPMAFPALYLDWTLQGKVDFKLSMANGIEVMAGLNMHKCFSLSLIGEMNGQTALLEKEGKDVIFTHQYIVAGLRPEFKIGKSISIPLTIGVNAVRPAFFSDRTLKAMFKSDNDYYFQVSPYVSGGVTIRF